MKRLSRTNLPNENIQEQITIATVGNANSGKSTLVGILTDPLLRSYSVDDFIENKQMTEDILDNGNGKARAHILQFIHEKKTGRTSSITYNYMLMNNETKVLSFVDLAGHKKYLKTTIYGLFSSYPDFALLCVEKNITEITRDHMCLLWILKIPFAVIFTKIDIIPEDKLKNVLKKIIKYIKSINKKFCIIKSVTDIILDKNIVNIILLSNKTGIGYNFLIPLLNIIKSPENKEIGKIFNINNVYQVSGYGTVVQGLSGIDISKNDELYIGPFNDGNFTKAKVRTLHDDYRNFVGSIKSGERGCLCIKISGDYKKPNPGMVLVKRLEDIDFINDFTAEIHILPKCKSTLTISENSILFFNSGNNKGSVKFIKIFKDNDEIQKITLGDKVTVKLSFMGKKKYIKIGERFTLRDGSIIGYGEIKTV